MSLMSKLKKNSTIKETSILSESEILLDKDSVPTPIPALNIALSGSIDGGLTAGATIFAGPSKHFKSLFSLIMAESYMKKYPESVLLFYDNEFGSPVSYFESVGIDPDRVLHTPITSVENLKHDISNQLNNIEKGERVIIVIDSLGNLASNKETEDAIDGKTVADMTRAKAIKSLFRIITVQLTMKNIPLIAIAHTYETMEMYAKQVVSGGKGIMYSADNVYIIGRQQEKDGSDLIGYNFIINVEKSRYCKEKSKIPITVSFGGGINKYSGLMDIALETGFCVKPKNGWYAKTNPETGEIEDKSYRLSQTNNEDFWKDVLRNPKFQEAVKKKFRVSNGDLIKVDNIEEVVEYDDDEV